jgi:hypothetical protein
MRPSTKVLLGVMPACVMALGAIAFVRFAATPYQWFLLVAAIVGISGLIWSLTDYSHKTALLVLAALVIGTAGMLIGGLGGAIAAFENDVYNKREISPMLVIGRALLVGWLVMGPVAVGIVQARQSLLRIRRPPNKSLERTRAG